MKVLIAVAATILLIASCSCDVSITPDKKITDSAYSKGVDDALDCAMLLDLELSVKGEQKTWGERAVIVRQRLIRGHFTDTSTSKPEQP